MEVEVECADRAHDFLDATAGHPSAVEGVPAVVSRDRLLTDVLCWSPEVGEELRAIAALLDGHAASTRLAEFSAAWSAAGEVSPGQAAGFTEPLRACFAPPLSAREAEAILRIDRATEGAFAPGLDVGVRRGLQLEILANWSRLGRLPEAEHWAWGFLCGELAQLMDEHGAKRGYELMFERFDRELDSFDGRCRAMLAHELFWRTLSVSEVEAAAPLVIALCHDDPGVARAFVKWRRRTARGEGGSPR